MVVQVDCVVVGDVFFLLVLWRQGFWRVLFGDDVGVGEECNV